RNLEEETAAGRFRDDLYYRLSVISLTLPPLRKRREDIPLLVRYFVEKHSRTLNVSPKLVGDEAMQAMINHDWRGNVRELQNAIERALTLAHERNQLHHLPQKGPHAPLSLLDLPGPPPNPQD